MHLENGTNFNQISFFFYYKYRPNSTKNDSLPISTFCSTHLNRFSTISNKFATKLSTNLLKFLPFSTIFDRFPQISTFLANSPPRRPGKLVRLAVVWNYTWRILQRKRKIHEEKLLKQKVYQQGMGGHWGMNLENTTKCTLEILQRQQYLRGETAETKCTKSNPRINDV